MVAIGLIGILKTAKTVCVDDVVIVKLQIQKKDHPIEEKTVFGLVQKVTKFNSARNRLIHPSLAHNCKYAVFQVLYIASNFY